MEQVQSATFVMNNTAGLRQNEISAPHQDQQLRKGSPSQSKQGQLSSPGSSLQDIWQILEMGSSPSILSPQSNKDQSKYDVEGGDDLILQSETDTVQQFYYTQLPVCFELPLPYF
uniref:Uncharacterized protein n=1 Tax=Sphaerodactylus townsendi TaxID=933632 RepID=A0ACB8EKC3_9SAUR